MSPNRPQSQSSPSVLKCSPNEPKRNSVAPTPVADKDNVLRDRRSWPFRSHRDSLNGTAVGAWKWPAISSVLGLSEANCPSEVATESTMPYQNVMGRVVLVLSGLRYVIAWRQAEGFFSLTGWPLDRFVRSSEACTRGYSNADTPHFAGHQLTVEESRPCR